MLERFVDNGDLGRLLLRVPLALLILPHGIHKLLYGYGFVEATLIKARLPGYLSHGILIGEIVAPLLILLGIYIRPAALLQVVVMVMAIYLVHSRDIFSFTEQGGYALELQMLYLTGSLAVFFLGAGRFSLSKEGRKRY
ncbi:MAG: DoxX family protein [Chlorobium sp.]|nr:MAG: DoxX family protein [Chlorobium sp.]